jgi:hypothetical protein
MGHNRAARAQLRKMCATEAKSWEKERSQPISRVLSRAIIPLGFVSPQTSSDLPGNLHGPCVQPHIRRHVPLVPLFGLAPSGVYRAVECYHRRGALLPHPFTLTVTSCDALRRFAFCCTFRGLTPPRRYLALCPWSPDFPPRSCDHSDCLADSRRGCWRLARGCASLIRASCAMRAPNLPNDIN